MSKESPSRADWLRISLIVVALGYAFFAGLRTVSDLDLGWQLATGRYLVEHHQIPRAELFSYTAHGNEWIYPPFSGVIFYLLYLAGGYSALSWLGAMACTATAALLCRAGRGLTAVLAWIAVPAIAFRTMPRAEVFTTVLFAAVLAIVWRQHLGKPTRLWLLPAIFLVWANLHLGFVSGLGVLAAGILFELCDMIFAERRAPAFERLKQVAGWFAAAFAATLVNPWGWRIYEAIYRQNKVMKVHSAFIGEWSAVQFNSLAWRQALDARNPASADWWLLGAGVLTIVVALWKKRLGPAIVVAAAMYVSIQHVRLQALYAIVAAIIGGTLLGELAGTLGTFKAWYSKKADNSAETNSSRNVSPRLAWLSAGVLILLAGIRINDIIDERYSIDSGQITLFGTGPSWWYPERAAAFFKREHLPGNVFHDYNLGGYLTWRIGPEYPDFVDGRYIPFGKELYAEQRLLLSLPPEAAEWKQAAERWQINTVFFSVARYAGLGSFPLQDFCKSSAWQPVYLDEVSIIFVRNRPENADLIKRLGIRCESAPIAQGAVASGNSYRARAERFNYLMNAGSIFYVLSRDSEAASALDQAEQIFPNDANLHLLKAQMFAAENRLDEAEREYLRVLRQSPSDAAWYNLARLYSSEHRYPDAMRCIKEAVSLSQVPYERLRSLGTLFVYMKQPKDALNAFARAERESPYTNESSDLGKEFKAQLAEGRARAYRQLNELDRAVAEQELATRFSPENPARWLALADLYEANGQAARSAQARERAKEIQKSSVGSRKTARARQQSLNRF